MGMNFSILGFIVGLVAAILIVSYGPDILAFAHDQLIYGLIALAVWFGLTFYWAGPGFPTRRV